MNSPQPLKQENVVTGSAPTTGAALGAGLGALLAAKTGSTDPTTIAMYVGICSTIVTAVFHWLGNKLGVNL